jgi:arylsulfatase A-like enzyme
VHITQYHREWDHHGQLKEKLKDSSYTVDQPIAGLLKDLKQRDLLDETLVLWGGEFGRTPTSQGPDMNSRAHYPTAFTMWMAGGGVKGGYIHGETDELGTAIARDRVHVHDLHATLLWLMGMDHEKLTYRYGGRDYRLTDVYGKVVKEIMA